MISTTPVVLEGEDIEALRNEALRLAALWMGGNKEKVLSGIHSGVQILDRGGDIIKVDDIRDLRRDALLNPLEGNVKVYIIANAHKMNDNAQNALLRLLEEPPSYARFILTSKNAAALLQTLLSRCVKTLLPPSPDTPGETEAASKAGIYLDAMDDPWKRAAVALSWEKLSRDDLKGILNAMLRGIRDRCLREGVQERYISMVGVINSLLDALERNAAVGSVCGILMAET